MSDNKVITRFAPSPTGFMHVGGVRTALFAWLWARKNKGVFILRIEDTDKKREVQGSIEHIIASLKWLNIDWDEGPDISGKHEPYKQSERLDIYKKYANILIEKGLAYADPYSEEELQNLRKKAEEEKRPFLYRMHRPKNPPVWDGTKPLRLKTNVKKYKWNDIVRGNLEAGEEALDDFVLIKSDGYPTYNFAHIIDDLLMEVTHIFRADEFISSTPNYLALYEALEIKRPEFATLPPILGESGNKKLGKRDGAKDILDYEKEGYLPESMFNFLAFIGWNPGEGDNREVLSKEEIIKVFDLKHIQKAGARFNEEKLDWLNKEHMKKLPEVEKKKKVLSYLPGDFQNEKMVPIIFERISKWSDIPVMLNAGELDCFSKEKWPKIDRKKLIYKGSTPQKISNNLKLAIGALQEINEENFIAENVKNSLMKIADGLPNRGEFLHPVRYALSGKDKSPDPFIIAEVLGKNETLSRLQKAV
ncbi:MAG: glutamate--tRNA ligase [Patescibacteria group bacterium]